MKKNILRLSALCAVIVVSLVVATPRVSAVEDEGLDDVIELVQAVIFDEEEALEVEDISDEELLEAEPSELPDEEEDLELTERLLGRMLLDVEGNGEVYYIDPVTKGKEYLADGESAQSLLRRRALGINEENFAKLTTGTEKDESNVCNSSDLGKRLRGRIVLRTEVHGEAYWIYPENCRAYYASTFQASYELMKKFSLGISKKNLAKVPDNARQKMKHALRLSVYADAEDNDTSLKVAKEHVIKEVKNVKTCMEKFRETHEEKATSVKNKTRIRTCVQNSNMPRITIERKIEIKETIKETRIEKIKLELTFGKQGLSDIDIKEIIEKVRLMIRERLEKVEEINCPIFDVKTTSKCYAKIAVEKNDFSICANLPLGIKGWGVHCYLELAVMQNDKEICGLLKNTGYQSVIDQCRAMVEQGEVLPLSISNDITSEGNASSSLATDANTDAVPTSGANSSLY